MCFWLKFSKHKKTMESSRLGFLDQWFLNCLVATKFSCPKNWTESRKERETESGKMGEGIQRQRFLVGFWKQVEKQERRKRETEIDVCLSHDPHLFRTDFLPHHRQMFSDHLWSKGLPLQKLGWPVPGRGPVLLTPSHAADGKGQRPWNAYLWAFSLFMTPQGELSVGRSGP